MDVAHRRLTRSTCFVSIARAPGLLQDLPRASMASLLASRRLVPCPAPRARGAGARARPRARGTAVAVAQEAASDASSASTAPSEDDGFTYERFQELLDKFDFKFKAGDKVTGHVLRIDNRGAYVDIGAKSAAFVPTHEVSIGSLARIDEILREGQKREFLIVRDDDPDGQLLLSLRKMEYDVAWRRAKQMMEEDATVHGKVVNVNRGGLLVEVEHLRGFVPTSHVGVRIANREKLIGEELALKFLEVDEENTRLVFSNRRAIAERQLKSFQVGDVVEGIVQAIKPYGAFVDIGGINGLLHISQVTHDMFTSLESVLGEGDKIKVMVISYDKERGRVSLSTKKLEPTPGDMLRNPTLVFDKAEEMAASFRKRIAEAEEAAREQEARMAEELKKQE
eukprot:jgi/Pico_ML_1/54667/g47.t2